MRPATRSSPRGGSSVRSLRHVMTTDVTKFDEATPLAQLLEFFTGESGPAGDHRPRPAAQGHRHLPGPGRPQREAHRRALRRPGARTEHERRPAGAGFGDGGVSELQIAGFQLQINAI